jgi:hypothetical protein
MTEHYSSECTPAVTVANEQQRAQRWLFKKLINLVNNINIFIYFMHPVVLGNE